MTTITARVARTSSRRNLVAVAWTVTILVSTLPNILWQEFVGTLPPWFLWAKLALLAGAIALGFVWEPARALRAYFALFIALYLAEAGVQRLSETGLWQGWFGGAGASFSADMLGVQLLRLVVSLVMIAALLILGFRRSEFFLVRGDLDAPVERVRWLGIDASVRWKRLGRILSLAISLGTLAFLAIAGRPAWGALARALPLLPAVLLFAVMNAFSEELSYRAAFLAPLHRTVGKHQSLMLTAAFFGLGHFYGVPYGVLGVVMAGILGWLLGKAMLETRGFFWPWFIHFLQDVLIFAFMGIGSIVAGGG